MLWFRLLWLKLKVESDSPDRKKAIQKLGQSGDDRAVPILVKSALTDDDEKTRAAAVEGLRQIGDPKAAKLLAGALKHESLRESASQALEELANWAVEPLVELLRDDDPATRQAAVRTLVRIGPEVVSPLQPLLQDPNETVREGVATALRTVLGLESKPEKKQIDAEPSKEDDKVVM